MRVSATRTAPRWWRQAARRALGALLPRRLLLVGGSRSRRAVCLTFDDGPDPERLPSVLDVLARERVRATFFLQGAHAERSPDLVRRIVREGHEIGHHSWTHSAPSATSAEELAGEAQRTMAWLRTHLSVEVFDFRPPHGQLSPTKCLHLWALGQTIVLWNVDPGDVFQHSASDIVHWFERHPPEGGDVVLLHDKAPHLVEALPHIIRMVRARALGFATVSEWTGRRAGTGMRLATGRAS